MRVPHHLLFGALLIQCGCSDYTSPDDGGDEPPSAEANVSVQDDQFVASSVRVLQGGTVHWTWRGSNEHNVTFAAGGPVSATQTNGAFQRTFDTAGTFRYNCTVHGQAMSGQVTVVAGSQAAQGRPGAVPERIASLATFGGHRLSTP